MASRHLSWNLAIAASASAVSLVQSAAGMPNQLPPGNPRQYMGVFGATAAVEIGADGILDDLTGRALDGLEPGDWQRRSSIATPSSGNPFASLNNQTTRMFGWGVVSGFQSPLNAGIEYPLGSPVIHGQMCVAGASVSSDGENDIPTWYIAQGVAARRDVFTVISANNQPIPNRTIRISVSMAHRLAAANRKVSEYGTVSIDGGGYFRITGAGVTTPFYFEWGQFGSLEFIDPIYPPAALVFDREEPVSGAVLNTGQFLVGAGVALRGESLGRSYVARKSFTLQPRLSAGTNKVAPSSITFTAETHTAVQTTVAAFQDPDNPEFGSAHGAAGAAFGDWILPPGYQLALVDDAPNATAIGVQVLTAGPLRAGSRVRLTAYDRFYTGGVDGPRTRTLDPLFQSTTYGFPLVGNSRTLFYLDRNNNRIIDDGDTLLGESNKQTSPDLVTTVRLNWGARPAVMAVFENALGERGRHRTRILQVTR